MKRFLELIVTAGIAALCIVVMKAEYAGAQTGPYWHVLAADTLRADSNIVAPRMTIDSLASSTSGALVELGAGVQIDSMRATNNGLIKIRNGVALDTIAATTGSDTIVGISRILTTRLYTGTKDTLFIGDVPIPAGTIRRSWYLPGTTKTSIYFLSWKRGGVGAVGVADTLSYGYDVQVDSLTILQSPNDIVRVSADTVNYLRIDLK